MKKWRIALAVIGILFFLSGITFAMQGYGIVGPPSSFMYTNAQWIVYGSVFAVVGIVLLLISLIGRNKPGKSQASPSVSEDKPN